MLDPQVEALSTVNWYPSRPYAEPAVLARVPRATYGTPYHIYDWEMRSTQLVKYEAPVNPFKTNQLYPIKRAHHPDTGTKQGAAPASGIYTGVPANGCRKGDPYS